MFDPAERSEREAIAEGRRQFRALENALDGSEDSWNPNPGAYNKAPATFHNCPKCGAWIITTLPCPECQNR